MRVTLEIWRQDGPSAPGAFRTYEVDDIVEDMSFLEMLDVLNERLANRGEDPIAFDSDCREGICGMCSLVINGEIHGPQRLATTCQVYMREFSDGERIWVEPFRARAFPTIKDLTVDRSALDRIIEAGGYISVHSGPKPEPNSIPIPHDVVEKAMDAAACIGCGACVAACPNGAAMLFTAAKISHLGLLPQGQPERDRRALSMVRRMDEEGLGGCTNYGECQEACPKGISLEFIGRMNRDYYRSALAAPMRFRGPLRVR